MKLMHQAHQLSVDLEQARETIVLKNKENLKVQWIMSVNSTVLTLMSLWAHETTTGTADTAEKMNDIIDFCFTVLLFLGIWLKSVEIKIPTILGGNIPYLDLILAIPCILCWIWVLKLRLPNNSQPVNQPTVCFTVNEPELTVNLLQLWGSNTAVWLRPA